MTRHPHGCLCFVVEDNPTTRRIITNVLESHHVRFREFSSVPPLADALTGEHPSLIFLDIRLEGSDAVGAIRTLEDSGYTGVIQIMSGRSEELINAVQSVFQRHSFDVLPPLTKPFRRAAIEDALRSAGVIGHSEQSVRRRPAAVAPSDLLSEAVKRNWIELHYQAKVDFHRGQVMGAESSALIRHPEHGLLSPDTYLPCADQTAIDKLSVYSVTCALSDWEFYYSAGYNLRLSVSIPLSSLSRIQLVELVRERVRHGQEWPGMIIEVPEREGINDPQTPDELTTQLQIYGIHLAVNLFAHGSRAKIPMAAFAEIKLDKTLVNGCAKNKVARRVCRALVELAHSLDARAIAESIDNVEDLDALLQLSCDGGLGSFFSGPVPRQELLLLLKNRASWLSGAGSKPHTSEFGVAGSPQTATATPSTQLTEREAEVLKFVVEGKSSKQIAGILMLSSRTVEVYRARMMAKLNARNVADLIRTTLDR